MSLTRSVSCPMRGTRKALLTYEYESIQRKRAYNLINVMWRHVRLTFILSLFITLGEVRIILTGSTDHVP